MAIIAERFPRDSILDGPGEKVLRSFLYIVVFQ
jgi:hypothetical protein